MKTNIRSFITASLVAIIIASAAQTVTAQETKKSSDERAKALTEMMNEKLTLDDNQYSKVYDINLKYIKKNEQLQNSSARQLSKLRTFRANQEAKDKELKRVLSSQQYKEYQQLKEKLKGEFKENRKNNN